MVLLRLVLHPVIEAITRLDFKDGFKNCQNSIPLVRYLFGVSVVDVRGRPYMTSDGWGEGGSAKSDFDVKVEIVI